MIEPSPERIEKANNARILAIIAAIATFLAVVIGSTVTAPDGPLSILAAIPLAAGSYYWFGRSRFLRMLLPASKLQDTIRIVLKTKQSFPVYVEYEVHDAFASSRTTQVLSEAAMRALTPFCAKLKEPPTLLEMETCVIAAVKGDPEVGLLGMKNFSVHIVRVGRPDPLPPEDPIGIYVGRS